MATIQGDDITHSHAGRGSVRMTTACAQAPARRPSGVDCGLDQLIGGLYDAALGDRAWSDILAQLSALVGGESAVLNHHSRLGRAGGVVFVNVDPAWLPAYDEHYRRIEPLWEMVQQQPTGSNVIIDRMLVPGCELDRSEFYADFLAPQEQHSTLCLSVNDDARQPSYIAIWRSRRRPPWGEAEMRVLRHLGPHLGRALRIDSQVAARVRHRAALAEAGIPPLSPRERDCLAWIARGATSRIAAAELGLSLLTVDDYIASAMTKLGAVTRAEAVYLALMLGPLGL
jgi:DNA-binding CsgD family transcriptional regulator